MIVVSIIGLLAISIALPNFARNREKTRMVICEEHRRIIEAAEKQYLFDMGKPSETLQDLVDAGYLDEVPQCPSGGVYAWEPSG